MKKRLLAAFLLALGSTASISAQSGTSTILISATAFLQGPFTGAGMTTTLNTLGLIPHGQPYNLEPFNYAGNESVTAIPADVTDWVLVELRNGSDPTSIVGQRAAFIKSTGIIVDLDGTSAVSFPSVPPGSYYIAIRHRNHLGIRSASPQMVENNVPLRYNFSTANQASGANAQMKTAAGIYAMWAGNTSYVVDSRGRQIIASVYPGAGSDVDNVKARVLNAAGNEGHSPTFVGPSITNVYDQNDVNLDGKVRYSSPTERSDVSIIVGNVMNWPGNLSGSAAFANCVEELP